MHPEVVPAIVDGMVYTTMFPGGNRHTNRPVISGGVALHAMNDSLNKASPPLEDTQAGGEKSLQSFAVPAGLVLRNFATPLSAAAASSSLRSDKTNPKSVLADDVFDVLYSLIAKDSSKQREDNTNHVSEPSPAEEKDDQEVQVNEEEKDNEGADNEAEKPAENEGEGKEDSGPPEDGTEPSEEALTKEEKEPEPTEEEEDREEGGKVFHGKPFKKISIKVPTKRSRGASHRKTRRKLRGGGATAKPT